MAFPCSTTEVTNLIPQWSFSSNTTLTTTMITQYINNSAAVIRGILRSHDIDESDLDSNATSLLNYVNQLGAACQASRSAVGRAMEMTEQARDFCAEYEQHLDELRSNPGILQDTDITSAQVRSQGQTTLDQMERNYEW